MSMRPQIPVRSSESEQALQFIRQMGIENVSLMLGPDELTAEAIRAQKNKLAAFGLLIVLVIPVSLQLSNMIEDTYQASIDATIQSAQDAAEEIEDSAAEGRDEKGFWAGLLDGITHAASGAADKVGRMANDFLEALAVMLVTSCIIPILVLLSFVWLAKTLLSIQIQIPLPGQAERQSDRRTASRVEDQKPQ